MGELVECLIEGQNRSAILEAVSGKLELSSGVHILYSEFETGSVGGLDEPHE